VQHGSNQFLEVSNALYEQLHVAADDAEGKTTRLIYHCG
jgi:hypothetical protein